MAKTNVWANELLLLQFNNAAAAAHGDTVGLRGSSAAGRYYMSLYSASPGVSGDQSTNEIAGITRVPIARSVAGFVVASTAVALATSVLFAEGEGTGTAAFWGLGCSASGAGKLLHSGAISPAIVCGSGIRPRLVAGTLITES